MYSGTVVWGCALHSTPFKTPKNVFLSLKCKYIITLFSLDNARQNPKLNVLLLTVEVTVRKKVIPKNPNNVAYIAVFLS